MRTVDPPPACISSFPCNKERSFDFFSGVAAWAVGVDPTESTNGELWEDVVFVRAIADAAISAASFTACNSAERNWDASSREVEAYD